MKRLLGLLLVMGMVGCGGGGGETVDIADVEMRGDLLFYEFNSKTPFTGVVVSKHENGQKSLEETLKDGMVVSQTRWDEEGNEIKE